MRHSFSIEIEILKLLESLKQGFPFCGEDRQIIKEGYSTIIFSKPLGEQECGSAFSGSILSRRVFGRIVYQVFFQEILQVIFQVFKSIF